MKAMQSIRLLLILSAFIIGTVHIPFALAQTTNNFIPQELRTGNFSADQAAIQAALELRHTGWVYVMPEPKSRQAAWGEPRWPDNPVGGVLEREKSNHQFNTAQTEWERAIGW